MSITFISSSNNVRQVTKCLDHGYGRTEEFFVMKMNDVTYEINYYLSFKFHCCITGINIQNINITHINRYVSDTDKNIIINYIKKYINQIYSTNKQ